MSVRILLVEDDRSLGATLKERLIKETYDVTWADTYKTAVEALSSSRWDLVVLDVGLPDGSGFSLARKIKADSTVPIIFVTAMNTAEYRLEGFEIGAEEFIPKPFHLKELLLRVKHVLDNHPVRREVAVGDLKIDLESMDVIRADGTKERPQAKDFRVLRMLIDAAPKAVRRDEILNRVWGEDKFPTHRTVDNSIVRLRQILGEESIRSVRGVGYQWTSSSADGKKS